MRNEFLGLFVCLVTNDSSSLVKHFSVDAFAPIQDCPFRHPPLFVAKDVDHLASSTEDPDPSEEDWKAPPPMEVNAQKRIVPLDGDHGCRYLDPLKELPTIQIPKKIHDHYTGDTYAVRSVSESFPNVGRRQKRKPQASLPSLELPNTKTYGPPSTLWTRDRFEVAPNHSLLTLEANADAGNPCSRSEILLQEHGFVGGTFECTKGGWPSKGVATNGTSLHWIREGFACLTDEDGERHYFGPGDTLIVPSGWCGRWDIGEDLKTIWLEHEATVVEASSIVRALVIHYHELFSDPSKKTGFSNLEGLSVSVQTEDLLYVNDSTEVSCFSRSVSAGTMMDPLELAEVWYVLEGTLHLEEGETCTMVESGDVLVLPKGWEAFCGVHEPTKVLRIKELEHDDSE